MAITKKEWVIRQAELIRTRELAEKIAASTEAMADAAELLEETFTDITENIEPVTKNLAKKQLEKGANAITSMMVATAKASVYAFLMEQFMEIWESLMWSISYWTPFITILAATIKYVLAPEVIELTILFAKAGMEIYKYRDALRSLNAQYRYNTDFMTGFVIPVWEEITLHWNAWMFSMEHGIVLLNELDDWFASFGLRIEGLEDPLTDFIDLLNSIKWPDPPSWLTGGNGDEEEEDDWWDPFDWFQKGGYTGNYTGLVGVHPDEYIIPGDEMRGGGNRMEQMYYEQHTTNDKLDILIKQNKIAERRRKFYK